LVLLELHTVETAAQAGSRQAYFCKLVVLQALVVVIQLELLAMAVVLVAMGGLVELPMAAAVLVVMQVMVE